MPERLKAKCQNLMTLLPANLYISPVGGGEAARLTKLHPPAFLERFIADSIARLARLGERPSGCSPPEFRVYLYIDPFRLCYLGWPADGAGGDRFMVAFGPFIVERLSAAELRYIAHRMKLGFDNCAMLESFFGIVPFFDRGALIKLACVFQDCFDAAPREPGIVTEDHSTDLPDEGISPEGKFTDRGFVEDNYKAEAKLLAAVERGDAEYVRSVLGSNARFINMPPRFPSDPLREIKNLSVTLNSISLRAAISGGLNPSVAHNMSHAFAVRIEQQTNAEAMGKLIFEIAVSYAEAVRKYALKGYSDLIVSAINYIRKNLTSPLSLKEIAEHLHISREHLCRQFNREARMSLTDFIHKSKIEESCPLLASRKYTIGDIALTFGYSSPSHYTKIFDKLMGMPPKRWQSMQK